MKWSVIYHSALLASLLMLATVNGMAKVTINPLFSDNMVLQRDKKVAVWGTAAAGEKVTVSIEKQSVATEADAQGKWLLYLKPMKAGGPYEMSISTADDNLLVKNMLIGEVWIASGQSNMEYGIGSALNSQQEIAAADYPQIRLFTVRTMVADTPQQLSTGKWEICTPETAKSFSAVAYFFARDLYKTLNIPLGIIHSSVSGTMAEAWTRPEVMAGVPQLQPILDRYQADIKKYQLELAAYTDKLAAWEIEVKAATDAGNKAPVKPKAPVNPATMTTHPGGLWNGKIAPLIPFTMRGVIWWQGEYNSERSEQYKTLFPSMIKDWRAQWGQGDFPFYFVQMQNLDIQPQPNKARYYEMRDAQLFTYRTVPNTGMAISVDIGDANNIHPPNKQEASRRLALIARTKVYGEKLVYSGPMFKRLKLKDGKAIISFSDIDGGLITKTGAELKSFTIAGNDEKFYPAEAVIVGKTVVVSCREVADPVAVRYAWEDNPVCSLYNSAGLPASPFRSDNWLMPSAGNY